MTSFPSVLTHLLCLDENYFALIPTLSACMIYMTLSSCLAPVTYSRQSFHPFSFGESLKTFVRCPLYETAKMPMSQSPKPTNVTFYCKRSFSDAIKNLET